MAAFDGLFGPSVAGPQDPTAQQFTPPMNPFGRGIPGPMGQPMGQGGPMAPPQGLPPGMDPAALMALLQQRRQGGQPQDLGQLRSMMPQGGGQGPGPQAVFGNPAIRDFLMRQRLGG